MIADNEFSNSDEESSESLSTSDLERLPFIDSANLLRYVHCEQSEQKLELVSTDKIISAPFTSNWAEIQRYPGYMEDLLVAIKQNSFDLKDFNHDELPSLFELDGLYLIASNGRHRVSAAKKLGVSEIAAQVVSLVPKNAVSYSEQDEKLLISRRETGLWKGILVRKEPQLNQLNPYPVFSSGEIESYEGPWVFSEDLEKAKSIYDSFKTQQ